MRNHPPTEIDPALAQTVRRLYVRPVDPDRARQDVATIAEAARQADQNRGPAVSAGAASHTRRRRTPLWRPVAAAAVALVAIPGGLAAAGVQLPEAVDAPYRAVGVSLPNQDEAARDEQPTRTTRGRSTQAPPATTPAAPAPSTAPSVTSRSDAARIRTERQERKERAERARRAKRRNEQSRGDEQRATPATPATPAQPGGRGGGATPAKPATPAQPARPQERSAVPAPKAKDLPRRTKPRVTGQGKVKRAAPITDR